MEGKETHGIPWHRWKDKITMHLEIIWCESVDWIYLLQERAVAGSNEHGKEPLTN
jgi:hypothetical protein